jgi:hypothetical protein
MKIMNYMDMINYIEENKLHKDALLLANKVGDIYIAMIMLCSDIPLTQENIEAGKKMSGERRRREEEYWKNKLNNHKRKEV